MNGFAAETISLSDLVRAEAQGLDLNRLLFARYLLVTGRITENLTDRPAPTPARGTKAAPAR